MRRVVVGVTGRHDAEPQLDLALDEALRRRLPLEVVHGFAVPSYGDALGGVVLAPPLHLQRDVTEHVEELVASAVERLPGAETVAVSLHVAEGDAASMLLARAEGAALVVVGRRGGGALVRGVRGSVSAAVLHGSWAPVLLVPPGTVRLADRRASRVLVGVDGSPASRTAWEWGVAQAEEWGCEAVTVEVPSDRSPAHVLAALPSRRDLVVVGSRGRGAAMGLLLGSASTKVAETCAAPVVVVRDRQARRETTRQVTVLRGGTKVPAARADGDVEHVTFPPARSAVAAVE